MDKNISATYFNVLFVFVLFINICDIFKSEHYDVIHT